MIDAMVKLKPSCPVMVFSSVSSQNEKVNGLCYVPRMEVSYRKINCGIQYNSLGFKLNINRLDSYFNELRYICRTIVII